MFSLKQLVSSSDDDHDLFSGRSALEPNSERVNGAMESFSSVPIDAMSEEKDIPLDDDNDDDHVEPQYEEEKLQVLKRNLTIE